MEKGLLIDAAKCICCHACEAACSLVKEGEINLDKSRIHVEMFPEAYFYYPLVCAQCEIAYCALPCPTKALEKNFETGRVDFFAEKCIGCNMCVAGCPFGAITVRAGVAAKCDLCDGDPACVKFCEVDAISYGEIGELAAGKQLVTALHFKDAAGNGSQG